MISRKDIALVASAFLFFAGIFGAYYTADSKIHELDSRRISELNDHIKKLQDNSVKLAALSEKHDLLSKEFEELKSKYNSLQSERWEQRYKSTQIELDELQKEYAALKAKVKPGGSPSEVKALSNRIKSLKSENEKLKSLYINEPDYVVPSKSAESDQLKNNTLDYLKAFTLNMSSYDKRIALIKALSRSPSNSVDIVTLAELADGMLSFDKYRLISETQSVVKRPISANGIEKLIKGMSSYDARRSVIALQGE